MESLCQKTGPLQRWKENKRARRVRSVIGGAAGTSSVLCVRAPRGMLEPAHCLLSVPSTSVPVRNGASPYGSGGTGVQGSVQEQVHSTTCLF